MTSDELICDICNKSCDSAARGFWDPDFVANEYATLSAMWGFCSDKDTEKHSCVMCEQCYNKIAAYIKSLGGTIKIEHYSPLL